MIGAIQIVYADEVNNRFLTLGGAEFDTMAETRFRFRAIPAVADGPIILDLLRGSDYDIVADKAISVATVEQLMGDTFDNLLAAGAPTE